MIGTQDRLRPATPLAWLARIRVAALASAAALAVAVTPAGQPHAQGGGNFLVGQWVFQGVRQFYGSQQRWTCQARLTMYATSNYFWNQICRSAYGSNFRTMQRGFYRVIGRNRVLYTATESIPDRSRVGNRRVPQRSIFNIVAVPDRNTMVIVNQNEPGRRYLFRRIGPAR